MRKFLSLFGVLVLCSIIAVAQTKFVTGRVVDQQGLPVPFATIKIKGSKGGTSADADGSFSIKTTKSETLIITGTGFNAKEVVVQPGDANLKVDVQRKESNLSEVVVTALGVQRQAKELGYSTAKVSGKDITQAKPISAINGLTGKVSGLQINTTNNGLFAPTRVTLRGNRSLTGNNQPLYVLDGSIFYNDISTINADDIVDITVLKGSSASAVYGSDASNGVIIITTKKGTRGKANITVSSTVQREAVAYLPAQQTRFGANGGERWVNDFNDLSTMVPYENQAYGPEFRAGANVPIGRVIFDSTYQSVPYSAVKNQKKNFFNKAITTQNNVSYSAGDDNSRFFLSGQEIKSKGVMPGDNGRRDAFRVGGSKTYGAFTGDYSLGYTYKYTDKVSNEASVYDLLLNTPAEIPLSNYKDWKNNKFATLDGYYNDYYNNPYWTIANDRDQATDHNLTGNVHLGLKVTSWLNLSYRLSMNNRSFTEEIKNADANYSTFANSQSNLVLYSNYAGNGVDSFTDQGLKYNASLGNTQATYSTSSYSNFLLTSDFIASFDRNLSKDFNLKVTLGTTYVGNKISGQAINAGPLFFPVYNVSSLTGIAGTSSFHEEARKLGYFGEATVGFREFAFLHGSYRTDIDSRLSSSNRYIPYYDIDGSLVISDLISSISKGNGLNFVKLRAAHSLTGNVSAIANGSQYIADGAYATVPTLYSAAGLGFPYNGVGGYALNGTIANPNIKPEKVTEDEIGLELGWQNKFSLVLAAYESKLKDGIVYAQIATSSGFNQALVNAANTSNKGLEAELKYTVIQNKNVTWKVGVNYSYNQSKVISINGNQPSLGLPGANGNAFAVLNQPYPVIESHDWVKDAQGRVIVDQVTGMPTQNSALTILGNANPKHILGFTTSVNWKRFSFGATADYRGGYKIFNALGQSIDFTGNGLTSAAAGRQRFVFPNSVYSTDGGKTYTPNTSVTVDDGNFVFWPNLYRSVGANYVVSAAAWKLREVTISYTIPRSAFGDFKLIQSASIVLSGRNLIMIRPKSNKWTDPEFNEDTGNDVGRNGEGQAPPTRILSATLSITF